MTATRHELPPFVDLHSHLVPGVDDGSESVEESLECLAGLYDEGLRTVITTPHLLLPRLGSDAEVGRELAFHRLAFHQLAAACQGRPGLPAIGLGQEIWAPDATTIRRVLRRSDVGLDGTRFLLVEFGFDLLGTHEDVVREVMRAGRGIVIAHPERYRYPLRTGPLDQMRRWRDLGALLQVNAGSFAGHYRAHRPESESLAWEMVQEGLVDLIGTDHHGSRRDGVSALEAYDLLVSRGEQALAERALVETPGAVARGELVSLGRRPEVRTPGADA
ncbi:MAG: hypothetical protein H0T44_15285 [Gemmatimonadales bacterium]|nr:hypothetical protein [Gemmatimonadales bacterium]